jgi:flagellar basal-body rod protein FlgC
MDFLSTFSVAGSGLEAQARRLRVIAENIANVDTPGFRRKLLSFDVDRREGGVAVGRLSLDQTELPKVYDPAHPLARPDGYYDGSNVSLVLEVADAREAQRSYEANLRLFDQARTLSGALLDLLKK